MLALSMEQVRQLRVRAQRLYSQPGQPVATTAFLVRDLGGIQSQELPAATLAVRPRSSDLTAEDVRQAREEMHSIVLTWWLRGTMHLVAAEDVARLLPLLGPLFIHASQRRYKQLDLTPDVLARGADLLLDALHQRGPLSRAEASRVLGAEGIPVEGQAMIHLVRWAALQGLVCFGPERNGKLTFAALEDWIAPQPPLDPDSARAELARRYLEAYGPAGPEDFASWTGLPMGQARLAFERVTPELLEVAIGDSHAWMPEHFAAWLDARQRDPVVRLLPAYDVYLLGYRSREFMVSSAEARQLHPGGGQIRPCLLVDGRAAGTWRIERKKSVAIVVAPFAPLSKACLAGVEAEAQDIGRFLQLAGPVAVRIEAP